MIPLWDRLIGVEDDIVEICARVVGRVGIAPDKLTIDVERDVHLCIVIYGFRDCAIHINRGPWVQ